MTLPEPESLLLTPFGPRTITLDGQPVESSPVRLDPMHPQAPDVTERFLIRVPVTLDGRPHQLTARIALSPDNLIEVGPESGERLEALAFHHAHAKLTLGLHGEVGDSDQFDYDVSYLADGLSYEVFPDTTTSEFWFGVAWLLEPTDDNQHQTWFAADPGLITEGSSD